MIIRVKSPTKLLRLKTSPEDTFKALLTPKFDTEEFILSSTPAFTELIDLTAPIGSLNLQPNVMLHAKFQVKKHQSEVIERKRDPLLCLHGDNAMCPNCAPLDPWNADYYTEKGIKYLSLEAYARKMERENIALAMEDYDTPCTHEQNIVCNNCGGPIMLAHQVYRVVDHVEFDQKSHVSHFISFWRGTGKQRVGYLLGDYQPYERIPLGVKAVVKAIYEPEQENFPDGFILGKKPEDMLKIAKELKLEIVGIIFTALNDARTFSVSSLELKFMSDFQEQFPFYRNNKVFGSRLVTVIASGTGDNLSVNAYQVSGQGMALLKGAAEPTENPFYFKAHRKLNYRQQEGESKIIKEADPYFPAEFFLVLPTEGFKEAPFFNTEYFGQSFSLKKICKYFSSDYSLAKFNNFNLILRLGRDMDISKLLESIKFKNSALLEEFKMSEGFQEFKGKIEKFKVIEWICNKCTFINVKELYDCEMCGLPKD